MKMNTALITLRYHKVIVTNILKGITEIRKFLSLKRAGSFKIYFVLNYTVWNSKSKYCMFSKLKKKSKKKRKKLHCSSLVSKNSNLKENWGVKSGLFRVFHKTGKRPDLQRKAVIEQLRLTSESLLLKPSWLPATCFSIPSLPTFHTYLSFI